MLTPKCIRLVCKGIYPTLIILLVALQRSTPDTVFTEMSEYQMTLEPMRFKEASLTIKSRKGPRNTYDSELFTDTNTGESSARSGDFERGVV